MKQDLPAFLLGLLATTFQITLLREFSAYFSGNELTLGFILASWLLWVGLGSLAAGKMKTLPGLTSLFFVTISLFPFALLAVRLSRFVFHLLPGEVVGLPPIILLSLTLCFVVGLPLGGLFVVAVNQRAGDVSRVYILESLGAAAAGPAVLLLLTLSGSSWATASIIAGTTSLLVFGLAGKRSYLPWALGITILLAGLWVFDVPSQGKYWTPFRVLKTRDTRYGRLQLVQAGEQLSLYSNNVAQFSRPDPGAAEESVHFAMLQNPAARRILLIGGGADGTLGELLKYAEAEIDYVELDPEIVRLVERFLGEEERQSLASARVRTKFQDGRAFLRTTRERYEIILLNLPEPSTAQVNRFYTLEFFALARRHLRPGGILSFPVLSSETAIGPELQQLLSSLRFTLSKVFSQVRIVPGERSVFLASDAPMTIDPDELGRRIDTLRLSTRYLDSRSLRSRLHALRVAYLEEKLSQGPQRLNSDFAPVGFFLSTSLWSTQFRGSGAPILRFLSRVPVAWLLGVPLLLFAGLLLALRATTGEGTFSLLPLVIMGLTTIVAEIVLLVWFQARYGFLYGRIALLVSTFMLGLFLGSLWAGRVKSPSYRWLAAFQAGLLALLGLFRLAIPAELPEAAAYLLLLFFGLLGGGLFIVSNRVYLRVRKDYGRGYGLELAGSFLGALLTSSLFIPLAGLLRVIDAVILLNVMGLLFLVSRPKRRGPLPV